LNEKEPKMPVEEKKPSNRFSFISSLLLLLSLRHLSLKLKEVFSEASQESSEFKKSYC